MTRREKRGLLLGLMLQDSFEDLVDEGESMEDGLVELVNLLPVFDSWKASKVMFAKEPCEASAAQRFDRSKGAARRGWLAACHAAASVEDRSGR